jgi:hypothetical protein
MDDGWGNVTTVQFREMFEGSIQNDQLVMRGTSKTITVNGQQQQAPPDQLTAHVENGVLVGRVTNNMGGVTTFRLEPHQDGQ